MTVRASPSLGCSGRSTEVNTRLCFDEGMEQDARGVLAVVLTHNSPAAVQRCVATLERQMIRPDAVLVVDNASDPPVEIRETSLTVQVLRLDENLGPAGGFARGLHEFEGSGHRYAWLMDDDCQPFPEALEAQLHLAGDDRIVLASVDADGEGPVHGHGWWGVLIPRSVVEKVGVPREDLFWWTEDTEYLQWRIPRAGFLAVWTSDAVMAVSRVREDAAKPAWKYYYEARNQTYHRLRVQGSDGEARVWHLTRRVRYWRAARSVGKLAVRAVWRERDGRLRKLWMVGRGAVDGTRGRLGRTVAVDLAHRPVIEVQEDGSVR